MTVDDFAEEVAASICLSTPKQCRDQLAASPILLVHETSFVN